jgi:SPP1 gp7 family putative phage head morphogenesis protein
MSDPTDDLREDFLRDIRERFRQLRGAVRRWVGYEEDVFGLAEDGSAPATDADRPDDAPQVFRFQSDREQASAFALWFLSRLRDGVLDPTDRRAVRNGEHWTASHIRAAFGRGWRQARNRLRQEGVAVGSLPGGDDDSVIEGLFNLPAPRRALRELYLRTYRNLESVADREAAQRVRSTLLDALDEGVNPRETARRLTDEVESIQKNRAETLARTETVNAYTESTISRYERAGVDTVQHGEWSDSSDSRVCPICSSLDGREIPMTGIRDATFTFEPDDDQPDHLAGEYKMTPPAHPNGRCVLLPVVA